MTKKELKRMKNKKKKHFMNLIQDKEGAQEKKDRAVQKELFQSQQCSPGSRKLKMTSWASQITL